MKQVIINADDFGLTKGINLGIIKAFNEGVVTSTNAVVNGDFFEHGAGLIRETDLSIGIHLNLTLGNPLLSQNGCRTLTDKDGGFFRYPRFIRRILLNRVDPLEIKKEFRAQIERFLKSGLSCSHINTHKHIGTIPSILSIILELTKEFGIRKMRHPDEAGLFPGKIILNNFFKRETIRSNIVSFLARRAKTKLSRQNIAFPDYFFGISESGFRENENRFAFFLKSCREGISEIMCHPSLMEDAPHGTGHGRYGPKRRFWELEMLTDPRLKDLIREMNIQTISFDDIS
jgi:chitin disaccharide deacetylase